MPDIQAPTAGLAAPLCASLADTAHRSLVDLFAQRGHRPSEEQWAAILDLLDALEMAAHNALETALYISAIPAGTGKTASILEFTKALLNDPAHENKGVLIAVNRVEEVRYIAKELAVHRGKLCVIVGRTHTDVLEMAGHADAGRAQVVVTTQAALKETLRTCRDFHHATRYHYRGERRAVTVWDEQFAFNKPVMIDADAVSGLTREMRRQSPEAATALREWGVTLDRTPAPGECAVPDFAAMGVDFHQLEEAVSDRDELVAQTKALAVISGGTGWVLRENAGATSMVSHIPELPVSLMPVIVTDASAARGVHSASYEQMARTRRVTRLKEAGKTYRNMTLRIVPTAASRSTYRDKTSPKGRELIDMAVRYIRSVAPDDVLVVSYKFWLTMKGVKEKTIRDAINARLTPDEINRVKHLTWGSHTATNDYKAVRRVLFMGLNFVPRAASYAASGAALNIPMRTSNAADHPTTGQVEDMRVGMLRDATLQAILRGNARMGVDGDCGVCEVVIPQVRQTGLSEDDYRGMFPGLVIQRDTRLLPTKPLKGKLKALSEIVARRLAEGEREMTNPSLYGELKMARQDFGALVKRPDWQAWIAAIGLNPGPLSGRVMGLRKLD